MYFHTARIVMLIAISLSFLNSVCSSPAQEKPSVAPTELAERAFHRRAVEAAIWGIPAVNTDLMFQAAKKAGAGENQIVYWSKPLDWNNQTLTPNPDAIYFMPFWNMKNAGPIVIEIPPAEGGSITGSLMDVWQVPLEDVGTAGEDKGRGGKYLIVPPDYKERTPAGYIELRSQVYQGYGLLRSILKSRDRAGIAAAVEYGKKIAIYPLSAANRLAEQNTTFIDANGVLFDSTIPYDVRFFESLDRVLQLEPWIERDRVMVNTLKSLGLEKGKPFTPDAKAKQIMNDALAETKQWFDHYYETAYEPFYKEARWFLPASKELLAAVEKGFSDSNSYPIDNRGCAYYFAFSGIKHMGAGQFYLFVSRDKANNVLDGNKTYILHVPPKPPVEQYWSVVLYDFDTHALIRDMSWSSRSSLATDLVKNADGSVDVYFGPKAPTGRESNWIPTKAGGRFEALFRLYGQTKPLFEKTWVLPDIEEVK